MSLFRSPFRYLVYLTLLIATHAPDIQAAIRRSDPPPPPPPPKHATQAGDWFTRLRALYFLPHNSSSSFQTAPYAGTGVDVRPFWLGEFDFGCMFTKQFGFEISLSTSETTLRATRALYDQKIGSTWVFPPTFTLQWRFAPTYLIQPYIGAGANYTLFYSKSCSLPSTHLQLSHSWGPVAQAGIDLFFCENHSWLFNFDVKYVWSKTKVILKSNLTETVKNSAHVDINPWVFGCGIGRKW